MDLYHTNVLSQTADGSAGVSYNYSYAGLDLFSQTANEYTTVQTFYPGAGSPVTLANDDPNDATHYEYSASFTSQNAMNTAFPTGTYSYAANGGGPSATTMINYANDAYPATQPYLAGTTYSSLQGMNSAASFTFQLSPFTKDASATSAYIFLNIFNSLTGNVVFSANFLSPSTTSVSMPANTLQPGTAYVFDLDYSDRVLVSSPGADYDATLGFDIRTDGNFTTAIPEPAVSLFVLAGIGAFLLRRVKKGRTIAASLRK
ncbi:MAG: hypothetical protein JO354_03940 [Verrucomicrobia bacterium]|nr:hypothetical protein [Verrucomicrobiota bacterium]